jgi:hypothetical protein
MDFTFIKVVDVILVCFMSSTSSSSSSAPRSRQPPVRFREVDLEAPPSKRPRNTWISKYDQEIVTLARERKTPTEIAEILLKSHDLDPRKMTRQVIDSRLNYLKRNKLATLPPVNSSIDLRAVDLPQTCKFFVEFSFLFIFFI